MSKNPNSGRFYFRLFVFIYCIFAWCLNCLKRRRRPEHPKSFLIAHHLLLGDTLMLTPMLAKIRRCYPEAVIYFLVSDQYVELYEKSPYRINALGFNPRSLQSYFELRKVIKSVDLALVPGDNRFSSLAFSLGSKWIIAFEDVPGAWLKNLFVDEFVAIPSAAINWEDMNLKLIPCSEDYGNDFFYNKADWKSPTFAPYRRPENYVVLHVGASGPLKYWPEPKWLELAGRLASLGYDVVWTASPKEQWLINQIDPSHQFQAYSNLSLAQLWHLIEYAELVICPDTGVAHLAKLTDTPVIVLFGQGSDVLFGKGQFFENHRFYRSIIIDDIACRDTHQLFKRRIPWVQRCNRTIKQCQDNICMKNISVDRVFDKVVEFRSLNHSFQSLNAE